MLEAPFSRSVFQNNLKTIMEHQREVYPNEELPLVLTKLVECIKALNGHQTEGIFRVPGDNDKVIKLRARIAGGDYDLSDVTEPHTPASLLKLWLRELEQSLFPKELYNDCLQCARQNDPMSCIVIMNKLPEINQKVIAYLLEFVQLMAQPEVQQATKMNIDNLAMVFSPSFLRFEGTTEPANVMTNQKFEQSFIRLLILGHSE